jgi:membrane protein
MTPARAVVAWWHGTLVGQSWTRQSSARGSVLAAGIAFIGFFALFPTLVVGFTVFSWLISDDIEFQQRMADQVNAWLGVRLLGVGSGDGLVRISDLLRMHSLTLAGIVGLVVMAASGISWLNATREGMRAVAGLPRLTISPRTILRDLLVAGVLGTLIVVSAAGGIGLGAATTTVLTWLGLHHNAWTDGVTTVVSAAVLIVLDAGVMWILVRMLAGIRVPWRDLAPGLLLGGIALQALKLAGGLLLHKVGGNPLLAGATALALLLLWMHLAARILLLTVSVCLTFAERRGTWPEPRPAPGSDVVEPRETLVPGMGTTGDRYRLGTYYRYRHRATASQEGDPVRPAERTASQWIAGHGRYIAMIKRRSALRAARARQRVAYRAVPVAELSPTVGRRSQDRVLLASGVILGASGVIALRVLDRSVRSAVTSLRPDRDRS